MKSKKMVDSTDGRVSGDPDFIRRYNQAQYALDTYATLDQRERDLRAEGESFRAGIVSQQKTTLTVNLAETMEVEE